MGLAYGIIIGGDGVGAWPIGAATGTTFCVGPKRLAAISLLGQRFLLMFPTRRRRHTAAFRAGRTAAFRARGGRQLLLQTQELLQNAATGQSQPLARRVADGQGARRGEVPGGRAGARKGTFKRDVLAPLQHLQTRRGGRGLHAPRGQAPGPGPLGGAGPGPLSGPGPYLAPPPPEHFMASLLLRRLLCGWRTAAPTGIGGGTVRTDAAQRLLQSLTLIASTAAVRRSAGWLRALAHQYRYWLPVAWWLAGSAAAYAVVLVATAACYCATGVWIGGLLTTAAGGAGAYHAALCVCSPLMAPAEPAGGVPRPRLARINGASFADVCAGSVQTCGLGGWRWAAWQQCCPPRMRAARWWCSAPTLALCWRRAGNS